MSLAHSAYSLATSAFSSQDTQLYINGAGLSYGYRGYPGLGAAMQHPVSLTTGVAAAAQSNGEDGGGGRGRREWVLNKREGGEAGLWERRVKESIIWKFVVGEKKVMREGRGSVTASWCHLGMNEKEHRGEKIERAMKGDSRWQCQAADTHTLSTVMSASFKHGVITAMVTTTQEVCLQLAEVLLSIRVLNVDGDSVDF